MEEDKLFNGLIGKFSPGIRRIAYKLNGRYRSFDHDDLYQEALLRLWNDHRAGKLTDKTDSYVLQGCYFHLKNCIRKVNERSNIVSLDALQNAQEDTTLLDQLLNKYTHQPDTRKELDEKLVVYSISHNGLKPKEKKVISFLSDGLTTREIGKKIGVSHVSVVKMIKRIREKSLKRIDKF
jgi:RNA polymerase sigma factor (sigma-70 family)